MGQTYRADDLGSHLSRGRAIPWRATRAPDQPVRTHRATPQTRTPTRERPLHRAVPTRHRPARRNPRPHARHPHHRRRGLATRLRGDWTDYAAESAAVHTAKERHSTIAISDVARGFHFAANAKQSPPSPRSPLTDSAPENRPHPVPICFGQSPSPTATAPNPRTSKPAAKHAPFASNAPGAASTDPTRPTFQRSRTTFER